LIRNLIFDMGQVLITFDANRIIDPFLPQPVDEKDRGLLYDACFSSGLWSKLDTGEVEAEEELIAPICSLLPEYLHPAMISMLRHWHEQFAIHEDSYQLVRELKEKGYRLYLLSNAGRCFSRYESTIPAVGLMDGKVVSAFYKQVKPNPGIYQTLFDTYSLKPEECLFIDDVAANIEGGRKLGMDGIVYDGVMEYLRVALREKGVDVSVDPLFVPVKSEEELQTVAALADEIWHEHFTPIIGKDQVDYMLGKFLSVPALNAQLTAGYEYYLLKADGKFIGFTGIHAEEVKLFLSKLYLKKEYRGKGYARKAMEFLKSICAHRKLCSIYLTCNKENANSLAAYRKLGFITVRKQVVDIGGGFVMDDEVLELPL